MEIEDVTTKNAQLQLQSSAFVVPLGLEPRTP